MYLHVSYITVVVAFDLIAVDQLTLLVECRFGPIVQAFGRVSGLSSSFI